jgi:hypothetical protein
MGFGVFPSYYFVSFFPVVQSSLSPSTIVIQTVRLYDIAANEEKTKFDHRAAVLECFLKTRRTRIVEDWTRH